VIPARNAAFRRWLQENATVTAVYYSGLIVVLLPAFHFVLARVAGTPPDSLPLRLAAAAVSAAVGIALIVLPGLRRYGNAMQYLNLLPTVAVVAILVVDSRNNPWYVASEMLLVVGVQQAFYRVVDVGIAALFAILFQAAYSAYAGVLTTPENLTALCVYGGGYAVAFASAWLRIGMARRELSTRLRAQQTRADLEDRDRALALAHARLDEIAAMAEFGNFEHDLVRGRVVWSDELKKIFGLPPDVESAALAGLYEASIHPKDADAVEREIELSRRTGQTFSIDHRIVAGDGSTRWFQLRGKHEHDAGGVATRYVAAVLDVTARKQAEEDLLRLSRIDTLTSLPNRSTFQTILRDALRDAHEFGRRCALLFLDLDRFKDINDTLGHALGDTLLRSVAIRLSAALPPGSTLARWGGDEFVVLLPAIHDDDEAAGVARALIHTIAEPFFIDEFELLIAVSAGIALYPSDGADATVLIRNADTAMYRAKERQGPRYAFFEAAMHEAVRGRHRIQNELRKAIANDDLLLHFQPIVEASTARVIGAEALVRLRQSDGSLLSPGEFIPIAEETGIVVPVGTWVLQRACEQIADWQRRGEARVLSVNVSAKQFAHPDFVGVLHRALRDAAIDPSLLDIEVTETVLMAGLEGVLSILRAIGEMGVKVTIDDFGTGYSSFAYLKRFAINSIKLDRTFVTELESPGDRAILRSIATIAHTLGLSVTAEGVETAAQLQAIEDARCDQAQGYYIAQPMPLHAFEAYCARIGSGPAVDPPRRALALVSDPSERIPLRQTAR